MHAPLIVGATFIAQWANPSLDAGSLMESLADVVAHVRAAMVTAGLGAATAGRDSFVLHATTRPPAALEVVNKMLFDDLGFAGNDGDFYAPSNSFIDVVLKSRRGIPITLCIVYQAVCSGVGLQLWPANVPLKFMLMHADRPADPSSPKLFVDVYQRGRLLSRDDVVSALAAHNVDISSATNWDQPCYPADVWQRMLRNLLGAFKRLRQEHQLVGAASLLLHMPGVIDVERRQYHLMRLHVTLSDNDPGGAVPVGVANLTQDLNVLRAELEAGRMSVEAAAPLIVKSKLFMESLNSGQTKLDALHVDELAWAPLDRVVFPSVEGVKPKRRSLMGTPIKYRCGGVSCCGLYLVSVHLCLSVCASVFLTAHGVAGSVNA